MDRDAQFDRKRLTRPAPPLLGAIAAKIGRTLRRQCRVCAVASQVIADSRDYGNLNPNRWRMTYNRRTLTIHTGTAADNYLLSTAMRSGLESEIKQASPQIINRIRVRL